MSTLSFRVAIHLSLTGPFPDHPLPDIGRTMEQLDPALLADEEKPHHPDVHQRHFLVQDIDRSASPSESTLAPARSHSVGYGCRQPTGEQLS
jgi:hypothetical protein